MTDKEYISLIEQGHLLYWDILGRLRGMENHREDTLRWLTGDVVFNYLTETSDVDMVLRRIKSGDIPKNLSFLTDSSKPDPRGPFMATGLFKYGFASTGMAHELLDCQAKMELCKRDKELSIYRVSEIAQLKAVGAILNSVFCYSLFSFEHFLDMFNIDGLFLYLAEYKGLPVGACMAQDGSEFVNISWVGTLPGYRKKGIGGHLIGFAEHDAFLRGKTVGTLYAFAGAVNAYCRVGYKEYCQAYSLDYEEAINTL